MEELLPFLQKFEIWIYIFLGAVALLPFQQLVIAWKMWQGSSFGLEREIAQRRFSTALTLLLLLVILVFLEFFIVSFVASSYPKAYAQPTPTLDLLATPTVTLPVAAEAVTAGPNGSSASLASNGTPDPSTTLAGTAQAGQQGCVPGQIEWSFPKVGQEITATIELKGTVNVPNLGFYKYEYAKQGDDTWVTIAAGAQSKVDGQIGFWNTGVLDPGDYRLRLVVADNQNNLFPACIIPVRVVKP